jgi:hypothetical protein
MIVVRYIRANDPGCRGADRHIIDRDLEIRHSGAVAKGEGPLEGILRSRQGCGHDNHVVVSEVHRG